MGVDLCLWYLGLSFIWLCGCEGGVADISLSLGVTAYSHHMHKQVPARLAVGYSFPAFVAGEE